MRTLLFRLWREESAVASPEWAFIVTILVLGAITGIAASRRTPVTIDEAPPAWRGK